MRAFLIVLVAFGTAAWLCAACVAAESELAPSLEEQLLDDLRADPIDDVDRELLTPDAAAPAKPAAADAAQSGDPPADAAAQLLRELGAAGVSEGEGGDPRAEIAGRMRQAEGLLAKTEAGPPTQTIQKDVIIGLEAMLKAAEKRCQSCWKSASCSPCSSCGSSKCQGECKPGNKKPSETPKDPKPADYVKRKNSGGGADPSRARAGVDKVGPGKKVIHQPTPEEMRALLEGVWGALPEREREQMLGQFQGEQFLPKYELLIEEYFRRLAENGDTATP